MILSNNNVSWSLWNPVTCKIIHLPPLTNLIDKEDIASIGQCCLSSPPDDDRVSVLLLTRTTKPTLVFCRLDGNKSSKKLRWIEMSYGKMLKKITGFDCLLHCPTVFNGKVYALNTTEGHNAYVIQVDIVAPKPYEEVIQLSLFGTIPCHSLSSYRDGFITLLKGSGTDLFYIFVAFSDYAKKTLGKVYLFKWVMTSTVWKELKDRVRASYEMKRIMWKQMVDLKDAVFFVDLASCDNSSVFYYKHAIASELGGYIHIRDDTGKMIYSYDVEDRTISPSYMSFQASHLTLWESSSFEAKWSSDCKQETNKEDKIMIRSVVTTDGLDESRLNDIPFDILEMITKLCVGVEYMHFRATCKHVRLAAPLIQWRSNKSEMRRLKTYSVLSPWLMVVDNNRGIVTFTDPILGDKYRMKRSHMSKILHEKILCARFGWMVYHEVNLSLVFFNPFTNEIHNHSLNLVPLLSNVCFSAPPTSLDCTVVGFPLQDKSLVYLYQVAAGERTWQRLPLDYGGGVDPHSMRFPTFVGCDLYALFNNGEIYVLRNIVNGQQDYSWKKVVVDNVGGGRSGGNIFW
ncbi:uncharacterized protein [Rutidosis leptorrhynchoides]|uniref:uncharacterized protein n=1 Tax=Rutidosis leptorrhynchoides TaxID=125765 RepID=UPI003A99544A